jgi:tRNA (guanine37-N1)-methyltransferase
VLFNQKVAERLSTCDHLILVCGRYEGVDERVQFFIDEELSIGDYILTGGELAALVVIDAVSRFVPGVVGEPSSVLEDTFSCSLLKYPQYTKPRSFRDLDVPEILLSGDHEKIRKWRRVEALKKTAQKRPDLLEAATLTEEDKSLLPEVTH